MKIYVIDDSMDTISWITDIIAHLDGLEIIGFTGNVNEVIDRFRDLHPDVVFLNYELCGGNSLDVLKKIRSINSQTTVAMLSSSISPELKDQCLSLGADYCFNKLNDQEKISQALLQMALSNKLFLEWYHMELNN